MTDSHEPLAVETAAHRVFYRHKDGTYADAPQEFEEIVFTQYASLKDLAADETIHEIPIQDAMNHFAQNRLDF